MKPDKSKIDQFLQGFSVFISSSLSRVYLCASVVKKCVFLRLRILDSTNFGKIESFLLEDELPSNVQHFRFADSELIREPISLLN
jgi:hypothetical protein